MLGRIILCTMLAAGIVGGVAWYTGRLPQIIEQPAASQEVRAPRPESAPSRKARDRETTPSRPSDAQVALATPRAVQQPARPEEPNVMASELITVNDSRLSIIRKQEVPSQQEGVLKWIGIAIKDGEVVANDEKVWTVEMPVGNQTVTKRFRRIRVGDVVAEDELLGLIDDTLARAEYAIKDAKLAAAFADQVASEKTRDEARKRYDTNERLYSLNTKAVSIEDVRAAELTWVRYVYEAKSKLEAIKVAQEEKNQAVKQLAKYEIRAKVPGVVKAIYKRDGEAVSSTNGGRNSEPVLLIHNYDLLNVEGLVDAQDARALQQGMRVVVEPMRRERPKFVLRGHRLEITGVAVSKDPQNRQIISASEDGTARVWDLATGQPRRLLMHTSPVRAIACTPPGAVANLCLTGTADGKAWLWDLNGATTEPLRSLQDYHRKPVSAVAFSPDARTCATGAEDGEVIVWDVSSGEMRYRIAAHLNVVTALYFTTDSQLVTVSRDLSVKTWKLLPDQANQEDMIKRRSNDVAQLGVSPDGKHVLDAAGKEMRILSLPGGLTETIFQNPSSANVFKSLALFSPDSRLIVTTSDPDGILQLWKLVQPRTYEFRQLMPTEKSPATCAAFVPDGSYVIGGSKDRNVYVWPMPAREEVEQQMTATLTHIGKEVEGAQGQVQVIAELQNPPHHPLFAGDVVTMVADPRK